MGRILFVHIATLVVAVLLGGFQPRWLVNMLSAADAIVERSMNSIDSEGKLQLFAEYLNLEKHLVLTTIALVFLVAYVLLRGRRPSIIIRFIIVHAIVMVLAPIAMALWTKPVLAALATSKWLVNQAIVGLHLGDHALLAARFFSLEKHLLLLSITLIVFLVVEMALPSRTVVVKEPLTLKAPK